MSSSDAIETEWQFEARDLDAVDRWLRQQPSHAPLRIMPRSDASQRDTYFDSEDWVVYRAHYGLRLRRGAGQPELTLKAFGKASGALRRRREISQTLPSADADMLTAAGPVSERLHLLLGQRSLLHLFDVVTRRRAYRVEEQGVELAEVALDDTRIERDGSVLRELRRVEVEYHGDGGRGTLEAFVEALVAAAGLLPAEGSKFAAGCAAAALDPASWPQVGTIVVTPDLTARAFGLATLRRFYREMVRHEPGTRLDEDPEDLHDMRVAIRRLRAALGMFETVLPSRFDGMREELRWVGQCLGEVRDLDVQIKAFETRRDGANWVERTALGELIDLLQARRQPARAALIEALDSRKYALIMSLLAGALAEPEEEPPEAVSIRDFAAPVLKQRYRRVRRLAAALTPESDPVEYHLTRVRAKRLRYSIESVALLYGRPAERMVEAVVGLQDVLGAHQDAKVAVDLLSGLAQQHGAQLSPPTLLIMGSMMESYRRDMIDLRREAKGCIETMTRRWRRLRRQIEKGTAPEPDPDQPPALMLKAGEVPRWRRLGLFLRRRPSSPS